PASPPHPVAPPAPLDKLARTPPPPPASAPAVPAGASGGQSHTMSPLRCVRFRLLAVALVAALPGAIHAAEAPLPATVVFNRDIRPIFADNCYACHGPDKNQRKADFRLDNDKIPFADRGGYYAIVPGKPHQSESVLP